MPMRTKDGITGIFISDAILELQDVEGKIADLSPKNMELEWSYYDRLMTKYVNQRDELRRYISLKI